MEEFKKELIEKINNMPGVKLLREVGLNFKMTGGAIVAAMDGTIPKDYDLLLTGTSKAKYYSDMATLGFNLMFETDNAYTYEKEGLMFQFIKGSVNTFDYTISQVIFTSKDSSLEGDLYNLKNKKLIPVTADNVDYKFQQLLRLPHYQNKGFIIHPATYQNLVESIWKETRKEKVIYKHNS